MRKYRLIFSVAFLVALTTGCAPKPVALRYLAPSNEAIWPLPPALPRYRYIGELYGEQNFYADEKDIKRTNILAWIAGINYTDNINSLLRPQNITVDAQGRILVTDVGQHAVAVFDTTKKQFLLWRQATKASKFISPIGIASTPQGKIFVSDADLAVIVTLDASGNPTGMFGHGLLSRPTGLAYNAKLGLLYVADTQAHDIKIFDSEGKLVEVLGHRGEDVGQFNFPTHIAYSDEKLYVTDALNSRIQVFQGDGESVVSFGQRGLFVGNLPHPKGVAVDADGNIYVIESYYDHLLVYTNNGEFLLPMGGSGKGVGQFNLPSGIWVDKNNMIYVADMFNARIAVFQYLGDE